MHQEISKELDLLPAAEKPFNRLRARVRRKN
jgi:hypothetical protein